MLIAAAISCSKSADSPSGSGGGTSGSGNKDTACSVTTISQVNSGAGAESSLSVSYDAGNNLKKIIVYDSVRQQKDFEAGFTYITMDSVRLNAYQYLILDDEKRVVRFVTKSDMADISRADTYRFQYTYNSEGYLTGKALFINGSGVANFVTTYTYSNHQLTGCVMLMPSSGNLKVLESTLVYDNTSTIRNWIYTFPDAMEGYVYAAVLPLGKHVSYALKRVVTKIYDPVSRSLVDTWATDYGNYKIDANGYILSGEAKGDLQQGIAAFYGRTNFYYTCP